MNVINESKGDEATPTPPAATSSAAKPKRVRRPNQRRPKVFPAPLRQKLANLGHQPLGSDTTDANLNYLIERLSADLQNYQVEAQHWQDKYLEFKNALESGELELSEEGYDAGAGEASEEKRRSAESDSAAKCGWASGSASRLGQSSQAGARANPNSIASTTRTAAGAPKRPAFPRSGSSPFSGSFASSSSSSSSAIANTSSLFLPSTCATANLHTGSSSSPNDPLSSFEYDLLHRLQSTANPTLSLVNVPPPNLRSTVGRSHRLFVGASGEHAFDRVLTAVSSLANLFGMYSPAGSHRWAGITKLKPDFSEAKARTLWNDIFAPINVNPAHLIFDSAPSSRRQLSYELDDPDMDHMDRKLASSSDVEVVDMLHYCSLLITGMHQAAFENEELNDAREHLGRNCERLLREAVFSRNIGSNPNLAQGLLAGIVGMLRHFSTQQRSGAVISILEIAWQMSVQHVSMVHPIMKGLVTFLSTVMAPSASRRAVWMARNQENFQSTSERYFHLTTTAYFTASYYALWMKDEDALLHYVAQLDEILAPCSSREAIINGPRYNDPGAACLVLEAWKDSEAVESCCPNRALNQASPGGSSIHIDTWQRAPDLYSLSHLKDMESPQSQGPFGDSPTTARRCVPSPSYLSQQSASQNSSSSDSSYLAPYPVVEINTHPESHGPYLSTNPTSPSSSDSTYVYPHFEAAPVEEGARSPSEADHDGSYIPDENFKSLLRVAVHLIRAEACLINMDEAMCRYWVDEAEKALKQIPLMFLSQRIFLVDVSTLKNIFKTECNFPAGKRSVAAEFERRMILNDREKLSHPEILKSTIGTTTFEEPTNLSQTNYTTNRPTEASMTASWEPNWTPYPPAASRQF